MIIAVDAMGGDNAPKEVVLGACLALKKIECIEKIFLVGDEAAIKMYLDAAVLNKVEILHTDEAIAMDEHPAQAYRKKKNASITLATKLVKEGKADAVVSAGSTGAQMVSGLFELGRIQGIKRPAIAVLLPTRQGFKLLVDAGANTEVDENNLLQFAIMGNIYMTLFNNGNVPKVALINNGTEESKGSTLTQAAYSILSSSNQLSFIGHIEGRDIMNGVADVMVCDGFTGNVILKTLEGFGKTIFDILKEEVNNSFRFKLGAVLLKPALVNVKNRLDSKKVGGAPLLGVRGVDIVCHGNSDSEAVYHGIRVATECVQNQLIKHIEDAIQSK